MSAHAAIPAGLEVIADDNNRCGEGPIWNPADKTVTWNDLASSLVFRYDARTRRKTIISKGLMVAGIALHESGGLVVAGATGLHFWRGQDDYTTIVAEHDGQKLFFNDILADPLGRVYAGTCYWGPKGMEQFGKLYLVDVTGKARVVADGIELSNGLGLSPDNRTLYYADSAVRRIYAFDVNPRSGDLSNRRVFAQVPRDEGLPDGLTVDRDGFVWCAQWYGAQVVRYDPAGKIERRIGLPVRQVSSVAFGGDTLSDLYITSASDNDETPLAPPGYDFKAPNVGGPFYRLSVDIQGRAEHVARIRPA